MGMFDLLSDIAESVSETVDEFMAAAELLEWYTSQS